jgi:hypothetical protein
MPRLLSISTSKKSRPFARGRRWPSWLAAAGLLAAVAGCGSSQPSDRLPVFPATGKIVFDGRPLTGAFVVLHPKGSADGKPAPRPHGQAQADGSFALTSYESNDGAPAGDYTLTVEFRALVNRGGDVTAGPNVLPSKYSRAETSPVVVQIASGQNILPEIQITK